MSSDIIDTMSSDIDDTMSPGIDDTSPDIISISSIYDECPICLEDLIRTIAETSCGHSFHFECLSSWIYKQRKITFTCPSCNKDPCEIINVYSKKKSVSKLRRVDSITIQEISELENNNSVSGSGSGDSKDGKICCYYCCIIL